MIFTKSFTKPRLIYAFIIANLIKPDPEEVIEEYFQYMKRDERALALATLKDYEPVFEEKRGDYRQRRVKLE